MRTLPPMIWVGTSGYNYLEWRGNFYPPALPAARMLEYYATRLPTVEINYSFYRMPSGHTIDGWIAATPETFRITLKAPRRITHDRRLRDCGPLVSDFCDLARRLGGRLGALLFQLPPTMKRDLDLLERFLETAPAGLQMALEFRHPSWFDEDVYRCLRRRDVAVCIADSERLATPVVSTASFGYYRLRDEGYSKDELRRWAGLIRAECGENRDAYVYFKHEEAGRGPEFARTLIELLGES